MPAERIFITDSKRAPGSVFNQRLERHDPCDCADHSEQIGICHAAKYNQDYTQNGHAELGLNLAVGAEPSVNPLELSLGIERPSRRVAS
jgi:hypothetical protein